MSRATWTASVADTGAIHTDGQWHVTIGAKLTGDDVPPAHRGRRIRVSMSPDTARALAAQLRQYADIVEPLEAGMGDRS